MTDTIYISSRFCDRSRTIRISKMAARVMGTRRTPCCVVLVTVLCFSAVSASLTFEDGFVWGLSISAYQSEGAWNSQGKGPSIWDTFTHTAGGDNGDYADDAYWKFGDDVKLLANMGVTHFRFSISWARIYPDGTTASRNQDGINHYNDILEQLQKYNITPVATLYDMDLPQALQDNGGWQNDATVGHFIEYAQLVFRELGDRVKHWVTLNDPQMAANLGYGLGLIAPGIKEADTAPYKVGYNMIRAHAKTYRMYERYFKPSQKGKVGLVLNTEWMEPKTQSPSDVIAAQRALQFTLGWFANPIYGNGDYPNEIKERVPSARLLAFTATEIKENKGSADFFGLSHFQTLHVSHSDTPGQSGYIDDQSLVMEASYMGLSANDVATGGRKLVNWIKTTYNNPDIYVMENGLSDCGNIYDENRIALMRSYLTQLHHAVTEDGCKIKGYMTSFMDGYDWLGGYSKKYGLVHVDFNDQGKRRTPKASSEFYKTVTKHNGLDWNYPAHFSSKSIREKDDFLHDRFPDDFNWGVATAAYQIEGGWNADGKGPSIWDVFAHNNRLNGGSTGDVACDSYHQYKRDVQMLKALGVSHYRFSIAWSRLLPDGTPNSLNPAAVQYYNNLIDELLANNIQPMVTLYHWDLPQALQEFGGWENETISDYFNDYAKICFEQFGDRVPLWITFNEAFVVSWLGYGIGVFAPGVSSPGDGVYKVAHHIIQSHVKAYHTYDDHFRHIYHGMVGITLDCDWKEPLTSSALDRYAAERALQFKLGWFANAMYGNTGDYPTVMRRFVDKKSREQGLPKSRLPVFTEAEKKLNKGAADFLGLNHYTTQYVKHRDDVRSGNYADEQDLDTYVDDCWPTTKSDWLRVNPWGIRSLLGWIKDQYGNPPVFITENGVSDDGTMNDYNRINYYRGYVNEILKAVKRDGCNVKGYMAWSLMDNLEWTSGYTQKFGLYHVDFDDVNRTRTPKKSVPYFTQLVADNGFP